MIHVSSGVLNRRGTACALEAESDWRTSKRSRRSHRRSVPASLSRAKIVLQSAGVEFIDENGGEPGVRVKKAKRETRNRGTSAETHGRLEGAVSEVGGHVRLVRESLH